VLDAGPLVLDAHAPSGHDERGEREEVITEMME